MVCTCVLVDDTACRSYGLEKGADRAWGVGRTLPPNMEDRWDQRLVGGRGVCAWALGRERSRPSFCWIGYETEKVCHTAQDQDRGRSHNDTDWAHPQDASSRARMDRRSDCHDDTRTCRRRDGAWGPPARKSLVTLGCRMTPAERDGRLGRRRRRWSGCDGACPCWPPLPG